MTALFLALQLAATLAPQVVYTEDLILSGTIVDLQGMPVSNADVGCFRDFLSDRLTPLNWVFADKDGFLSSRHRNSEMKRAKSVCVPNNHRIADEAG